MADKGLRDLYVEKQKELGSSDLDKSLYKMLQDAIDKLDREEQEKAEKIGNASDKIEENCSFRDIQDLCEKSGWHHRKPEGKSLADDLKCIKELFENDDASFYRNGRPVRDKCRENLFALIADGELSYDSKELYTYYQNAQFEEYNRAVIGWVNCCGESSDYWGDPNTEVTASDGYKRFLQVVEDKLVAEKGLENLSPDEKGAILSLTQNRERALHLVYLGTPVTQADEDRGYNYVYGGKVHIVRKANYDNLKQLFTGEELNEIVHHRLTALVKNYQWYKDDLSENVDDLSRQKEALTGQTAALSQEKAGLAEEIGKLRETLQEKKALATGKDIGKLPEKGRKDLFEHSKQIMQENPNSAELALSTMFKIYAAAPDGEEKKGYLEELCLLRKGGKDRKENLERARLFGKIMQRNPELKDNKELSRLSQTDNVLRRPAAKLVKKTLKDTREK